MTNVLPRDLPEDVHAALLRKVAARERSLHQFLLGQLGRIAEEKQFSDVLDEVEQRCGG